MGKVQRFVLFSLGFSVACLFFAQAQEAPKPGAEHEKLGFWVGNWTNEGEIMENPMMPAGKFASTDTCEWFEGKFAVVCRTEGQGPMGPSMGMGIMSYSADQGVYTYYGTDSTGMTMTTVPRGKFDGKTWVYDDESMMGDQKVKSRYTMVQTSDSSYTFEWEIEGSEGWTTVMKGEGKKKS